MRSSFPQLVLALSPSSVPPEHAKLMQPARTENGSSRSTASSRILGFFPPFQPRFSRPASLVCPLRATANSGAPVRLGSTSVPIVAPSLLSSIFSSHHVCQPPRFFTPFPHLCKDTALLTLSRKLVAAWDDVGTRANGLSLSQGDSTRTRLALPSSRRRACRFLCGHPPARGGWTSIRQSIKTSGTYLMRSMAIGLVSASVPAHVAPKADETHMQSDRGPIPDLTSSRMLRSTPLVGLRTSCQTGSSRSAVDVSPERTERLSSA